SEFITKILFDENHNIIGDSIVGTNAGELISEAALAIEMGCDSEDIALTVHPHQTQSESLMMATEGNEGTAKDLPQQKNKN
ncbi:dihydrolipoyl dehydrogenase, partial [Francisella tularensis subsp. holarctica]|nr:dihydrolipoyl dehydrogenase [Francisella tularensis subsp. holarctica]